jgi:hypothetical protein
LRQDIKCKDAYKIDISKAGELSREKLKAIKYLLKYSPWSKITPNYNEG